VRKTGHVAESIEQLSYELTANALAEQERALAGLRTCAGTVLGAASIAGSLLAAATSHGSLNPPGVLAVVAFALCAGSATWVLIPHRLVFALGGGPFVAAVDGRIREVTDVYRAANAWSTHYLQANASKVAGLSDWLTASCLMLSAEIVLWALSIAV
jgi:hypothetical protein